MGLIQMYLPIKFAQQDAGQEGGSNSQFLNPNSKFFVLC